VRALAKKYKLKPPVHLLELLSIIGDNTLSKIDHLFVLVLENRSFDHIFGLSQLTGMDVITGEETSINSIPTGGAMRLRPAFAIAKFTGFFSVRALAKKYKVQAPVHLLELLRIIGVIPDGMPAQASNRGPAVGVVPIGSSSAFVLNFDVGHEFKNVKRQLCGVENADAPYTGSDDQINNSGFVLDFQILLSQKKEELKQIIWSDDLEEWWEQVTGPQDDPMHCFTPAALPVLTALAKEFVVCDNWFSSVPGPTFPNRMFIHAATSDGFTGTPEHMIWAALIDGYEFANGHIFDRLDEEDLLWLVYVGDLKFNQTVLMAGIDEDADKGLVDYLYFTESVARPDFDASYVFIEPTYDPLYDYVDGNSMHPLNDPSRAEALVKEVYETIRKSPCWERSALVITFDEHGGFFDHLRPPDALAPGDLMKQTPQQGFDFTRLGVRVPAIIVSPLIPKNTIDHTIYDHTSILATLRDRFGIRHLTQRDETASPFSHVFRLPEARKDTPLTLPHPAEAASALWKGPRRREVPDDAPLSALPDSARTFILAAAVADRKARGAGSGPAVAAEVLNLRTVGDARRYASEVDARVALRPRTRGPRVRRKNP